MATIDIHRTHSLGKQAARQGAEAMAKKLQSELNVRYYWEGDDLRFECPGANGRIRVGETGVSVEIDLSFLLRPMRGRIEQSANAHLDECLAQRF